MENTGFLLHQWSSLINPKSPEGVQQACLIPKVEWKRQARGPSKSRNAYSTSGGRAGKLTAMSRKGHPGSRPRLRRGKWAFNDQSTLRVRSRRHCIIIKRANGEAEAWSGFHPLIAFPESKPASFIGAVPSLVFHVNPIAHQSLVTDTNFAAMKRYTHLNKQLFPRIKLVFCDHLFHSQTHLITYSPNSVELLLILPKTV